MQKAIQPGRRTVPMVARVRSKEAKKSVAKIVYQPSTHIDVSARNTPMIGASQKSVAKGLLIPIDSLSRRSWISDHRRPPRHEAVSTSIIPTKWNCVSADTIMTTPPVMMEIIPMSGHVGFSSLNMKANSNTNPSVDDLHIAVDRR